MQFPVGSKHSVSSVTTLEQPLFTGLALVSQYQMADLDREKALVSRTDSRQELILKTYEVYFGVLLAEKYVDVAAQAVTQLESHAEVSRQFYANGMIPKNDMLKSLVTLAEAEQSKFEADHDLQLAWAQFFTLARLDPRRVRFRLTEPLVRHPYPRSMEECIDIAVRTHPSVRIASIDEEMGRKAVTLSRSSFFPNLALVGALLQETGAFIDYSAQLSATLHGEWNVWEWGSSYYKVQKSRAELEMARAEKVRQRDLAQLDVAAAFLELEETDKAVDVAKTSIDQAKENYRITVEQYNENMTTSTEVLDAQVLQARSQMNYYQALTRYNIAIAKLQRAMGVLGEAGAIQIYQRKGEH